MRWSTGRSISAWARETIVTIDDDLGRSGKHSSSKRRLGFQRLVAEVGLGHVSVWFWGSRCPGKLARSCRDRGHQLLEICALFDTLIADVEGVAA